jgi:hypothetical protein
MERRRPLLTTYPDRPTQRAIVRRLVPDGHTAHFVRDLVRDELDLHGREGHGHVGN